MAKTCLINSPIRISSPPYHVPLGLAQLCALADQAGHEVALVDANLFRFMSNDVIRRDIKEGEQSMPQKHFDLIGLSGLVTTYQFQRDLLPLIKKDHPEALTISGGGCASSIPNEMMAWMPDLDLLCIGEGEKTFMEILKHLDDENYDFSDVKGVYWREDLLKYPKDWYRKGKTKKAETKIKQMLADRREKPSEGIVKNPPRPLMTEEELNELPYPAFKFLQLNPMATPLGYYGYFMYSSLPLGKMALASGKRLSIITSRGCPYNCFPFDTDVAIDRTNSMQIGELVYNPPKSTLSYQNGLFGSEIIATQRFATDQLIEIETEDGEFLRVTPDNLIWTRRGWITAENLKVNDQVWVI